MSFSPTSPLSTSLATQPSPHAGLREEEEEKQPLLHGALQDSRNRRVEVIQHHEQNPDRASCCTIAKVTQWALFALGCGFIGASTGIYIAAAYGKLSPIFTAILVPGCAGGMYSISNAYKVIDLDDPEMIERLQRFYRAQTFEEIYHGSSEIKRATLYRLNLLNVRQLNLLSTQELREKFRCMLQLSSAREFLKIAKEKTMFLAAASAEILNPGECQIIADLNLNNDDETQASSARTALVQSMLGNGV